MSEMVERVAEAIFQIIWPAQEWGMDETLCRAYCDISAKAAIRAMREPSEDMLAVFDEYHNMPYNPASTYRGQHTWQAMIDAALPPIDGE